jgi:N-acetylglutamate synthase-like GNAT family acetyltransferase
MSPIIRIAKKLDVKAITELVNLAYRPGGNLIGWTHESELVAGQRTTEQQINLLLSEKSFLFVANINNQIVACVHLKIEDACAHIGMLATHPQFQERGYGKLMLVYAENYAREALSINKFVMTVITERTELVSFYLRRGYIRTGKIEEYPVSAGVGIPKVSGLTLEILEKDG